MKKYNLSMIMKSAHRNYKRANGSKSFSDCLKSAWKFAKLQENFSDDNISKRDKEAAKSINASYRNVVPAQSSSYNDLSIPQSAYYNPNSKGRFGSHYVGD